MLALRLLPHQKLDLHLREKRLNPPLPKEALSIKCQTVLLITLLREHFFQTRGGEGRGWCPGGYAAIAVCEAGEFGGRGGARGGVGCRVRVTGMLGPGRPRVVSRTWQVIGGFFSGVDIFAVEVVGGERWFVRAEMRCVVDMRVWWVEGVAKV